MALQSTATPAKAAEVIAHWTQELSAALKREKNWRKRGAELVDVYECGKEAIKHPYNILYSNTETLSPALYNQAPRPRVKPRYVQKDNALTRLAALMGQRLLQHGLDNGDPTTAEFDEIMRMAVTESLVPGRGLIRIRYNAIFQPSVEDGAEESGETTEPKNEASDGDEASVESESGGESNGDEGAGESAQGGNEQVSAVAEQLSSEECLFEAVSWDDFLHGAGKEWTDVPWVAFRHYMTKEDLEDNFQVTAKRMEQLVNASSVVEDGGATSLTAMFATTSEEMGQEDKDLREPVWEIWDKVARKVLFISLGEQSPLKEVDDPCKLQGFFPIPRPLQLYRKMKDLVPQALYEAYRQQAEELNDITIRITKITRAMRIRGFYNSGVEQLGDLMKQDDNTLLPLTNAGQITAQGLKLDDAIWLFPIEKLVPVLQQLYNQRQQAKTIIFELTGIADIMRGSSQASETLGAQQIKSQWGTLRLKRMQKEVARFSRDALRIYLEMMVTHVSSELLRAMTGLPFPTQAEQQQMLQAYQQSVAQAQMQGQPAPPQPPEMAAPTLEVIVESLRTDMLRNFSIDVETNSTVDAEATEDKQDMAEMMNALAQFLNGVAPLVQSNALPMDAAKLIMINLLRRFNMGGDIEEAIMAVQPPSQGGAAEQQQLAQMKQALEQGQQDMEKQKQALMQDQQKLAMDQNALKLQTQEAQQNLAMERDFAMKEIDMQKRMASKEVDQHKSFAIKEVQAQAQHLQQVHQMHQQAESAAFSQPTPGPVTPAPSDLP